jgi:hypothetical protein
MLRKILAAFALCFAVSPAMAITLMSTATGNIGTTATWSVVDTTGTNAFLNSETANTALTTSPVASSTFTPAAETITSIGVKLASVAAAPSGTMTVKLANSTSPGSRECTLTVNVSDLAATNGTPAAATADGGWVILACSASPNGTDSYTITANTSVAAQVNLFSLATTNWSRLLVTSGTQTNGPAAGDKFYVFGQLTGAGTHNAYVVTINTTALVNYGNVANTTVDPSIAVGQWGTLQFASAASTAYVSEFAGPMVVYNGGTYTVGTSGTPIPSTGSATLTLNSTVEGDTGIIVRNGGTMNVAGSSGGRNVVKTKLTATANAAATSLTTADTTGWLSGDSLEIAGTAATAGTLISYKDDQATLSGNASGTTVTISAGLTNVHTAQQLSYTGSQTNTAYSANLYPDVILLNRNVVIQGSGTTTNGYVYFQNNSVAAMTWVQFSLISGTTTGKRGVEIDTGNLGSFSLTNFSHINSHNTAIMLGGSNLQFGGGPGNYLTIQHGSIFNAATNTGITIYGLAVAPTAGNSYNNYWKIDDIAVIRAATGAFNATGIFIGSQLGQFSNISVSGSGNGGGQAMIMTAPYNLGAVIGGGINTFGPIYFYADIGRGLNLNGSGFTGKIAGLYLWNEAIGFTPSSGRGGDLVLDPFFIINTSFGVYYPSQSGARVTFRNGVIGWTAILSAFAFTNDAENNTIFFDNMDICPKATLGGFVFLGCQGDNRISLMHDISPTGGTNPSSAQIFLRNSSLSGTTSTYPTMNGEEGFFHRGGLIAQDCSACTPLAHAAWVAGGFLSYDTTITHSSGFSQRMTPKIRTFSGYIAGTALTVTTAAAEIIGDLLTSDGSGFVAGTSLAGGTFPNLNVNLPQTVGSSGSPVHFQSYNTTEGALLRMQSAPTGYGAKIAVASGVSTAQACVWIRPSINTDASTPWGTGAVTYNGDNPRMIVRANPFMGVQTDTVLGTSSPTAGAWSQFCATLPTAPADGKFEVVVDADQTFTSSPGGSVNITEWSCTTCGSTNTGQFWWNGSPADFVAPAATGSGNHIIGG